MEAEVLQARVNDPSIEDVNKHLLAKLDDLIDAVDSKDADMVRALTESVAKLNASLKGNNIFTPQETAEQKKEREATEAVADLLKN